MVDQEIFNECKNIVDQVCLKYGYDDNKKGNDSLKTVLLKAIPAMLKYSNQQDRKLFYQMLSHTPIIITENLTKEGYDKLVEQYIGTDSNQHIIEEEVELGEYGKTIGTGAYISEPILDENMNLKGKKSFIYIQRVTGKAKEFFGTDINVSHLIHELGHAWHAEKEQFVMRDDGTLKERVGTAEFIYSFSKTSDNKYIKKCIKTSGLMIEESMNTIDEETVMANYMGISLEEMRKEYRTSLVSSNYQGYMADFVGYMIEKLGKEDFEQFRLYGEVENKNKINELMEKTNYWKNRETDILASSDSPRNYDKKRAIINRIDSARVQDFFKEYEDVYFPDISQMTPLEKIDNVLEQKYNMNMVRYNMGVENYRDFLERISYEGFPLINQSADLVKENKTDVIHNVETANIKEVDLTNSFFHFTLRENLESIQKYGLKANIGAASEIVNEEKPRVYMSKGGKGILEIKNSFIHKFKGIRICDIPLEYREYFEINDFSSTEQVSEEIVYEAMEKRFKDEIYFKVDAVEGEDFLPEDFLPEELINEIKTSKSFRDVKGKENHDIDIEKLTLLESDSGKTALDITEYLYNRLLENAKEKGLEDSVRSACSDLDGLFEYIKQKELSNKKIMPVQVFNNALKETTADKVNEANGVEYSELNPDKIKEGATKDD